MANAELDTVYFLLHGVDSIYANHNAFLDWRRIHPVPTALVNAPRNHSSEGPTLCEGETAPPQCFPAEASRSFDLLVSSRFNKWKRVGLAADVAKVGFLTFVDSSVTPREWPTFGTVINRLSETGEGRFQADWVHPEGTSRALSRARVGGIFSAIEGACYSSTEYLLAGLPVVSTPSLGGRDVWYSPANSVIVQPTRRAVAAGVAEALQKLDDGTFNRASIRAGAIALARLHRARFVAHFAGVLRAFEQAGVNASAHFDAQFVHKLKYD